MRKITFCRSASGAGRTGRLLLGLLLAKDRNGKLALIAVCNKLLKRAFAIVTSGLPYQADFTKKATAPLAF